MEQPSRSPTLEHFSNPPISVTVETAEDVGTASVDDVVSSVDPESLKAETQSESGEIDECQMKSGTESAVTTTEVVDAAVTPEDSDESEVAAMTAEDSDEAHTEAATSGDLTPDNVATDSAVAPLVVTQTEGRVCLTLPTDLSLDEVHPAMTATAPIPAGALWLHFDGTTLTEQYISTVCEVAQQALKRPVSGVHLERAALTNGLRSALQCTVEIEGEHAPTDETASRGRQVLVVERTLRSGTMTRFRGDVLVYGDVNAGAEINATGNIVVLGALRGLAWAGSGGDESATIVSFDLRPTQIRIGEQISFLSERSRGRTSRLPEIAAVKGGEIVLREYRGRLG